MHLRLDKCPVCRARLDGAEPLDTPCRRCGENLRWVRAAERHAERSVHAALESLRAGDRATALEHARRAQELVDHPETRAVLRAVSSGLKNHASGVR